MTVFRHAKAFGLIERRDMNIKAVLTNFIERAGRVKPTAQALIAAVVAFSKLDAEGRAVERVENVTGLGTFFGRMTRGEALTYATSGVLPEWWLLEHGAAKGVN
jgi:hypothetical protein